MCRADMIEILLIDDDVQLGALMGDYLLPQGFRVTASATGEEGVDLALSGRFALVLLDVMLPGIDGIEVLRRVRARSAVAVVMLTARGDDDVERVIGLELGADDYLAKPCFPRELLARLRAVLRRTRDAPAQPMISAGRLRLDRARRATLWGDQQVVLTATEFNLLELLMHGGNTVSTRDALCLAVLGRSRHPYDRSIDVHMSNLRLKLDRATGRNIGIETVRGVGYRLRMEGQGRDISADSAAQC